MKSLPSLYPYSPFGVLTLFSVPVGAAVNRAIGLASDARTQAAVQECSFKPNRTFNFGECSGLVKCVLDGLPSDISAGMQSGANIASLVPTILVIVGAAPLDLVQLAFISPHRAAATCMFGVGLPSGLFWQLQVHLPHLADKKTSDPRTRQWLIPVRKPSRRGSSQLARTLLIDAAILALASVMLWRNITVGLQTVVTWRCEYSWLLTCWPMACLFWLIIAIALLHVLAESIQITYSEDSPGVRRTRLDLILLSYRAPRAKVSTDGALEMAFSQTPRSKVYANTGFNSKLVTYLIIPSPHSPCKDSEPHFMLTIKMRTENSWGWFESTIEALAVGVYLYATFVVTSSLFLSGSQAILYATAMILSMSAIRVSESL
ncbi:MAG: hypothetical protein Q9187_002996 [Circinaria calcarea]